MTKRPAKPSRARTESATPADRAEPAAPATDPAEPAAPPTDPASKTDPETAVEPASPADPASPTDPEPAADPETAAGSGVPETATADHRTTDIVAGPGGVMTDEVGVITGDLTIRTEVAGNEVRVRVQYKDAEEWYDVTGARAKLTDPADADAVHTVVTGILHRPEG